MKKLIIYILFIISGNFALAQHYNYSFQRVSPEGGFTFGGINKVIQDNFGNIWLSTNYGLIRYDSENIVKFENRQGDTTSLLHNVVTDLIKDKQNDLWIATRIGLCKFNPSSQTFTKFSIKNSSGISIIMNVLSMDCDKNDNLWLVDPNGVGILNKVSHRFYRQKTLDNESPRIVYSAKDGNVWVGTANGSIYLIDPETLQIERKIKGEGNAVESIYTENNKLYVGYNSNGLSQFSENGNFLKQYLFKGKGGQLHSSCAVRKVIRDKSGRLWIGTNKGIYVEEENVITWLDPDIYTGLANLSTFDIFEDKEGGIWVGTWTGGLSYFHSISNQFKNYSHNISLNSVSNNIITSFAQNWENDIFVGTETGGVNIFNKKNGTFSQVYLDKEKENPNIKCQCTDSRGGHWIGTNNQGLWYKKYGDKEYVQFSKGKEDGKHLSNNGIYSVFPVDSGIWIGTHGGGINFYSHSSRKITFFRPKLKGNINTSELYIRSIFVDSYSNLWIGTVGGLLRISLKTKDADHAYNENESMISYKYVFFITQLSDGKVWMGTRGAAVSVYDSKSKVFSYFDAAGLLKENDVYGIVEDVNGNIWFSSDKGLVMYDSKSKKSYKFTKADGIQGNLFNPQSVFVDNQNDLYFGGTQGFSIVKPNKININTRLPEVTINKIIINNKDIKYPFYRSSDKQKHILRLKSKEKTIKIEFHSDNYLLSEKNKYKYRLVNYYDEWIETDKEAIAFFVNLPAGNYTFEVLTANNDGLWSATPASFVIDIAKPLYATNLAIGIFLLLIILVSIIAFRIIRMRGILKNEVYIEKLQRKQEEQMHEIKLKFFTNISHEFRTPLSLISGPVKILGKAENLTKVQTDLVDVVWRNTSRLLTLINQVVDLRKIDKKEEKLIVTTSNIVSFIKDKVIGFSNEVNENKINFVQKYSDDEINMDFDVDKMEAILFNLLSNAFKYTPKRGSISLSVFTNNSSNDIAYTNQLSFGELLAEDYISIEIEDSGSGIDSEDLMKIFNRYGQGKNVKKGSSGIGLSLCHEYTLMHHGRIIAQSTPGKGSRFIVQLPQKQRGQKIFFDTQKNTEHLNFDIADDSFDEKSFLSANYTVLIVEDNNDFRYYLDHILETHFKILLAENGAKGLQLLQDNNVDLVVSDVMMPGMSGYEFCSSVKSNIATSHIPVILLTALSSVSDQILGIKRGADAYISKPFEDELLILQIKNLLQQREKLRRLFLPKLYSVPSANIEGLDNYFLKKLNGLIEENISSEEFSIEQLVQQFGISRSHLHRKLKSLTNYSTTEYIRVYRLEKAIALMQKGEYNLDEIAFLVGFNTHAYFTRCFKKHYKMSPREYKKKLISIHHNP